jgi:cell division protein FtsL
MMKNVCTILMTLAIPAFLFAGVWQSSRYNRLENEVRQLDKEQYEVILQNKRLISGISVLSTPERIEKVAVQDLKMRKALPIEIMRIELKKGGLGG